MEIEVFNAAYARTNRAIPTLSFYKGGQFFLNKVCIDAMNLQEGATISFVRDRENPKDWYILRDPDGIKLGLNKNQLKGSHSTVRKEIDKVFPAYKGKTIRFKMATEPTQCNGFMMYAILTSKPI